MGIRREKVAKIPYFCGAKADIMYLNTMRRLFFLLMFLPAMVAAQGLHRSGSSPEELIPSGWSHQVAEGDFNADGHKDAVVLAHPTDTTNVLAIYFGSETGKLTLWKEYADAVVNPNETTLVDTELEVTSRGVIRIRVSVFMTAGGYGSTWTSYAWRYQKAEGNADESDFYLIGKDEHWMSRMSGEDVVESYNYITCKCQRIVSNAFDDTVKPRETWRRIRKEPLQRLGTVEMG